MSIELIKSCLNHIENLPKLADPLESSKRLASYTAVDTHFLPLLSKQRDLVVGVGSGTTVVYVAERLGEIKAKINRSLSQYEIICIPTGFQSKQLILDNNLRLGNIEEYPKIDIVFDGADESDPKLNLIKGGGACLFQEKLISRSASVFIVVADYRKQVENIGSKWSVPIEVVPSSYVYVTNQLKIKFGHILQKCSVRQGGKAKAGPVVTDNGNFIIDVNFGKITKPTELHEELIKIVGIVETGIFPNVNCEAAYFGHSDGTVVSIKIEPTAVFSQ
ncbi:related to Ribose-5-phosphate isomerase [Saccharomycodes ludwigii]|uniref:Ribose-5-phosphate isomerase n=1 Tax=Saccharomycodes ludwigii TaxID=36035 RepID=A0A376B1Z4_9ASCO|nr:hypothetical protein SCDLUD_002921 [Saccharomycodes ludwigii]KAH3901428.1 hypothetical protein SCDLUD_002921 [Saccharomycodes ludwigii]SSD58671.1 related to Ribose-5-phosphate isomerase [Saccharomycodes ludwigii]